MSAALVANLQDGEPKTVKQALLHPKWTIATREELHALCLSGT